VTGAPAAALVDRFRVDLEALLGRALAAGERLALAVSGGPDSMAMLVLAQVACPGMVIAATVDHGLRADSAGEAAMVAAYCAAIGVPHAVLHPREPITGASLQAQARAARYAVLTDWVAGEGAIALLTAHHADDQAETFLMRAARGSGLAGLAGVRARRLDRGVMVLRPLLEWRRAELRAIVRRAEAPFIDDPANSDPRHDRTRFRRLLEANEWLDPPNIARAAAQLAELEGEIVATFDALWAARAVSAGAGCTVDVSGLPRELRRRLARRAIATVRAAAAMVAPAFGESANIEKLLDSLEAGRRATQAGVLAAARGSMWRFRTAPPRRSH
jgi:tRNA(Ile)-lysidine synthase